MCRRSRCIGSTRGQDLYIQTFSNCRDSINRFKDKRFGEGFILRRFGPKYL